MRTESASLAARFSFLKGTPFHPQWFVHRGEKSLFTCIGRRSSGRVLDVGCSDQRIKAYLAPGCEYIGLDYYSTASSWYKTRPSVYGDAHALPFTEGRFDTVLLLDVLEHLRSPQSCMAEVSRVLIEDGLFFVMVPFMYPIHDAPFDFGRWTSFGLAQLAEVHEFDVVEARHVGEPAETAALMTNIAWSKAVLRWANAGNPLMIFALLLPFTVLFTNLLGAFIARLGTSDQMMPNGYFLVLKKRGANTMMAMD
ncbi:MAG: class I SAM-dependent methyltransferase [Betaproteobacteria bacterium]